VNVDVRGSNRANFVHARRLARADRSYWAVDKPLVPCRFRVLVLSIGGVSSGHGSSVRVHGWIADRPSTRYRQVFQGGETFAISPDLHMTPFLLQLLHGLLDDAIATQQALGPVACMHDGGMVAVAEVAADLLEAVAG